MSRVLIVEDDSITALLVEKTLNSIGAECVIAEDPETAFAHFRAGLAGSHKFSLICLDLHLGGGQDAVADGVEFLQEIRALEEQYRLVGSDGVKVIAITGDSAAKSLFATLASGCSAYLLKPLDREKLLSEVRRLGVAGLS